MNPPVLLNSPLIRRKLIGIKKGRDEQKMQRKKKLDVYKISYLLTLRKKKKKKIKFLLPSVMFWGLCDHNNCIVGEFFSFSITGRECDTLNLTLFVNTSIEDSESWDMECLRTPLGMGEEGLKEDGERAGDLRAYKGMTLSCCESPVVSITGLLVRLSGDLDPSVGRETR